MIKNWIIFSDCRPRRALFPICCISPGLQTQTVFSLLYFTRFKKILSYNVICDQAGFFGQLWSAIILNRRKMNKISATAKISISRKESHWFYIIIIIVIIIIVVVVLVVIIIIIYFVILFATIHSRYKRKTIYLEIAEIWWNTTYLNLRTLQFYWLIKGFSLLTH